MTTTEPMAAADPHAGTVVLDPTGERRTVERARVARPATLDGLTIGLLDISKMRGDVFLDRIDEQLTERGHTCCASASRPSKPAPVDLRPDRHQPRGHQRRSPTEGSCTSCSVHDIADLEARGIPGVFVASAEFVTTAATQARHRVRPGPPSSHPIRTAPTTSSERSPARPLDEILAALLLR
jgi:hypothetical protein